jgi:hypothetical protein
MVDKVKVGGRTPPNLTSLGYFFHHYGMYARKWPLPLCVICEHTNQKYMYVFSYGRLNEDVYLGQFWTNLKRFNSETVLWKLERPQCQTYNLIQLHCK